MTDSDKAELFAKISLFLAGIAVVSLVIGVVTTLLGK